MQLYLHNTKYCLLKSHYLLVRKSYYILTWTFVNRSYRQALTYIVSERTIESGGIITPTESRWGSTERRFLGEKSTAQIRRPKETKGPLLLSIGSREQFRWQVFKGTLLSFCLRFSRTH
jgi:hypothetical protein